MSIDNEILDPELKDRNFPGNDTLPNATATLVLGIISIVGCFFYGIPGLICGIIAMALHTKDKKMHATSPARYAESFKLAKAGFICAIVGTSLSTLYFLLFLFILLVGASQGAFPFR